jgi:NAD(P)-dependent dehydrogenase (short-subunit alcohol dehydrogenase family)
MADQSAVVIVTGAGGGLGGAMARGLLAAGRRVVALDIAPAEPALRALAAEASAQGTADRLQTTIGSVRSPDDAERVVAEAVARFGAIDALINNAGIALKEIDPTVMAGTVADFLAAQSGRPAPPPASEPIKFYQIPVDKWRDVIDTNVNGPFFMARAVASRLVERGWGRIINVVTSHYTMHMRAMSPYGPSKAALESATAVWAKDLAGTGVTVNALLPGGPADTGMVPTGDVPNRTGLISPSIMIPAAVWLTSRDSDGTTSARLIAKDWDPAASAQQNVAKAVSPVGWLP